MAQHWFIVPPVNGPLSGGTLYNRELLRELSSLGLAVGALEPPAALEALEAGVAGVYWVDSLFLSHFAAFRQANRQLRPLGLLAHYLPSLVDKSDDVTPEDLSPDEAFALARADVTLAPSDYMKRTLDRLGLAAKARCLVVEPGCPAPGVVAGAVGVVGVRAVLVANLTPGKGVEPFLRALAAELRDDDELRLEIVGRLDVDAAYTQACFEAVQQHPKLARRVTFSGALTPAGVTERLRSSNLLVSASRMESFGMAIAEARTLGLPVLALARGNVPALVEPAAGGVLASTDGALARACVELARDPATRRRNLALARSHPRPPRSFAEAARDFVAQLSTIDLVDRA